MKTALFISPHLDDVAFSCGGTLMRLAAQGWRTILCTIFTRSVPNPQGFALACQLDKGLAADVDYMRLRRAEDLEFARIANVSEVLQLDFAEAPHRGYESAAELFAEEKPHDQISAAVAVQIAGIKRQFAPALVFAPQGIGRHIDHRQTVKAVLECAAPAEICWYFDTPYVIKNPCSPACELLPGDLQRIESDISDYIARKADGCAAYASQIGFQFGSNELLRRALFKFHSAESGVFKYSEFFLSGGENTF